MTPNEQLSPCCGALILKRVIESTSYVTWWYYCEQCQGQCEGVDGMNEKKMILVSECCHAELIPYREALLMCDECQHFVQGVEIEAPENEN